MKNFSTLCVSVLLSLTTGCSLFVGKKQSVSIQVTEPAHAKVWVNGAYEGEAPVVVSVPRNQTLGIIVKQDGYQTSQRIVQYSFSTTGTLDLVGGCIFLLPLLGLTAPGAHSLDDTTLVFKLMPAEKQ